MADEEQRMEEEEVISSLYSARQEYAPAPDDFQGPNFLIGAKYASTLFENKVLALALSKGDQVIMRNKAPTVKISPGEIRSLLGLKGHSLYGTLDALSKALTGRVMGVTSPQDHYFKYISVISYAEYKEGYLYIGFNPALEEYLFRLKKDYTLLSLKTIGGFSSGYTLRLYEILRQVSYQSTHFAQRRIDGYEFEVNVAELKLELGVVDSNNDKVKKYLNEKYPDYEAAVEAAPDQKYRDWRNFRQRVLLVAQKEMAEKSDICFEMEPIREGHKIKRIRFIVHYQKRPEELEEVVDEKTAPAATAEAQTNADEELASMLIDQVIEIVDTDPPLARKDAEAILSAAGGDMQKVQKAFDVLVEAPGEITNVVGFLIDAIRKGYEQKMTYKVKRKTEPKITQPELVNQHQYDFKTLEKQLLSQ